MSRKFLITLLSAALAPYISSADYITPEDLVELSPGVYARSEAAALAKRYDIRDLVVKLYNQDIKEIQEGITLVHEGEHCINLYINTKNKVKNFISQISTEDAECFKK
jgi:hypothetical protein